MLKGVIDIGTNSVRLGIQSGKTMQKYVITTRLGQGSAKGQLQPEPMRRTAEAVCSLCKGGAAGRRGGICICNRSSKGGGKQRGV